MLAYDVAVQQRHRPAAHLQELHQQHVGDRGLARAGEAGEEHREALLVARRVAPAQLRGDLREGEPLGDLATLGQSAPQLGSRDAESAGVIGDLVVRDVLIQVLHVDHHPERDHGDAQFFLVLLQQLLGVVGAVEGLARRVRARAGVVAPHDEVGAAVVLADDGVPHRLARPAQPHGDGQQGELCGVARVAGQERLIAAHARVVVDVAGLGHAHHRVDQQVGLDLLGGPERQLLMGPVHRVPGLEGNDPAPAEPGEVLAQLGR